MVKTIFSPRTHHKTSMLTSSQEELSVLKHQNVSRSLSFRSVIFEDSKGEFCDASAIEKSPEVTKTNADELQTDGLNSVRVFIRH